MRYWLFKSSESSDAYCGLCILKSTCESRDEYCGYASLSLHRILVHHLKSSFLQFNQSIQNLSTWLSTNANLLSSLWSVWVLFLSFAITFILLRLSNENFLYGLYCEVFGWLGESFLTRESMNVLWVPLRNGVHLLGDSWPWNQAGNVGKMIKLGVWVDYANSISHASP